MNYVNHTISKTRIGILLVTTLFTLLGCGNRQIGFGVVLHSSPDMTDVGFVNGSLVPIESESEILNAYTIVSQNDTGKQKLEVNRWRIEFFQSRNDAEAFQARFESFSNLYGSAGRQGLPIRNSADNTSNLIYRMRKDEQVKIIGRHDDLTNIAGLEDYWYEVLTDTGVRGWAFGYDLSLVDSNATDSAQSQSQTSKGYNENDPLLRALFENTWRPEYFLPMIRDQKFDLSLFRPEYGFFPNLEDTTFTLRTHDENKLFKYTSLYSPRYAQYQAEGSSLQITMNSVNRLVVQYEDNGSIRSEIFTAITEDIPELIQAEIQRRYEIYQRILDRGTQLTSSHYGVITLSPDFQFTWTGFDRVQSGILPAGFDGSGKLAFDAYLGEELAAQYSGVLTLTSESWGERIFLYELVNTGIRLEAANLGSETAREVTTRSLSPFIMFFEFGGPTGELPAPEEHELDRPVPVDPEI